MAWNKKSLNHEIREIAERMYAGEAPCDTIPTGLMSARVIGYSYDPPLEGFELNSFGTVSLGMDGRDPGPAIGSYLNDACPGYAHSMVHFGKIKPSSKPSVFELPINIWIPDYTPKMFDVFKKLHETFSFDCSFDDFLNHIGFFDCPVGDADTIVDNLDYLEGEIEMNGFDADVPLELTGAGRFMILRQKRNP